MARLLHKKIKKQLRNPVPCFNKISREKIYSFIDTLNWQVASFGGTGVWQEEDVHDLRKKLKELLYTINIFQVKGSTVKGIDDLQDLIGKWHDKVVIASKLSKREILSKMKRKEKIILQPVVEKLNQSSGQLLVKIHEVLHKQPGGKTNIPCINEQSKAI